jgi:hypothetical protein
VREGRRRLNGDRREKSKGVRVPRERASERERGGQRKFLSRRVERGRETESRC